MAGIGFELRKLLQRNSLLSLLQAYAYAGLISSGPWILSIIGILLIGIFSLPFVVPQVMISQFQVSVMYLIALSLILTGPMQLAYTRFFADRLFAKELNLVLSNFHGVLLVITALAMLIAVPAVLFWFPAQSVIYRLLMLAGFVIMCHIWLAVIFLSSMKQYLPIVGLFMFGYGVTTAVALLLDTHGLNGLLSGFVLGQGCLLAGLLTLIYREFQSDKLISFEIFQRNYRYPSLMAIGLLYNFGIWIDKLMFWYNPGTGQDVIGPLRASIIYDMPLFLAYLAIIPGMAIFLMRIETDIVEYYTSFYDAIREGESLQRIENTRNAMIESLRAGLFEIVKIQTMAALILFAGGAALLNWLKISTLYLPLMYVDVLAASLQVLLMGILNVFFYLDKRREALTMVGALVLLNMAFTAMTLARTPIYYGYGFALALLIVVLASGYLLDRRLDSLEFDTYMLQ